MLEAMGGNNAIEISEKKPSPAGEGWVRGISNKVSDFLSPHPNLLTKPELFRENAAAFPEGEGTSILISTALTGSEALSPPLRRIRSFVLRDGRITAAQQAALDSLWPIYGLNPEQPLDAAQVFGRKADLILEIGFGNGESLVTQAAATPEKNFIGIEVHRPGVGHCLMGIQRLGVQNLRLYRADALEVLERCIPDQGLDGIQLYFPDPWPKSRHHKRRIVNTHFVDLVARKLNHGGFFHAATDWEAYAQAMLDVLKSCHFLHNTALNGDFVEGDTLRPGTKFEQRGRRLGHGVWDMLFQRN